MRENSSSVGQPLAQPGSLSPPGLCCLHNNSFAMHSCHTFQAAWRMHVKIRQTRLLSVAAWVSFVAILQLIELPSSLSGPAAAEDVAPGSIETGTAAEAAPRIVKLPGIAIDLQRRCVDLEGRICLQEGLLELVACTEATKEHESIVSVSARAMHIHTALLLVGADNGHPVMRRPLDEKQTRWRHLPARGDVIEVFLLTTGENDKPVERPISDFIIRSRERVDEVDGVVLTAPSAGKSQDRQTRCLTNTFIFAGSQLKDDGPGPRQYLADISGNVISIATFGDEVLCLPFHETQHDGALMWRIKPKSLPKVGTKVTLRLRPKQKVARPGKSQ